MFQKPRGPLRARRPKEVRLPIVGPLSLPHPQRPNLAARAPAERPRLRTKTAGSSSGYVRNPNWIITTHSSLKLIGLQLETPRVRPKNAKVVEDARHVSHEGTNENGE